MVFLSSQFVLEIGEIGSFESCLIPDPLALELVFSLRPVQSFTEYFDWQLG